MPVNYIIHDLISCHVGCDVGDGMLGPRLKQQSLGGHTGDHGETSRSGEQHFEGMRLPARPATAH